MKLVVKYGLLLGLCIWIGFILLIYWRNDQENDDDFTVVKQNKVEKHTLSILDDEICIYPLNLSCKPESFGYTTAEATTLFANITYPKCESLYNSSPDSFYIDRNTDTLHMNCSGLYILGQFEFREQFGRYQFVNKLKEYTGPVKLESQEYAFGTCDKNRFKNFEHVDYRLKLKEKSLKRAMMHQTGKVINVVMLVIDSVSRRNFYRKLPKSVNYLNSLPDNISVFDFKLHHILGQNSPASYMPTFYGEMAYKVYYPYAFKGDLYHDVSI